MTAALAAAVAWALAATAWAAWATRGWRLEREMYREAEADNVRFITELERYNPVLTRAGLWPPKAAGGRSTGCGDG